MSRKTKIGILGGGQLGLMLARAAERLPFPVEISIYDRLPEACARTESHSFHCGDFDDVHAIQQFAKDLDVITYEFENISPSVVEILPNVPQGTRALRTLQNRLSEKKFINSLPGIPTVPYTEVTSDFSFDYPYIVKTAQFGYDGKGQHIVHGTQDLKYAEKGMIAEQYLPGITEYSLIIARNIHGEIAHFPIFENVHRNHILDTTWFASVSQELESQMIEKAQAIIRTLDYYGVLTVEFFLSGQNLYVNEVAPRVHNSGHITLNAANVSQFDLHIYSLLGMNFPKIIVDTTWCMVNVLGQHYESVTMNHFPGTFYDYGKNSTVKNRKVGHINGKLSDIERLKEVRNR